MKQYKKPEIHFVNNTGGLSGDEIAKLSDEDLAKYLHACNYTDEKKKYRIRQGFILREIAGEYAIVPVGEECMITNRGCSQKRYTRIRCIRRYNPKCDKAFC